ncbi:MAG: O-antigen ligase family protein [Cyclobacteriaceae bacterium]
MILLPIAFNVFDLKIGKIDKVFLTYSVCMSLLLMVCFGIAIINAFHYGDFQTWPFKYYNFTYAVGFHPSYLTTLILISIIVILQLLHHQRYLILCFILLLIQIFSILFIGSRYGIFTLAAILTFQLVYVLYCKIHWAKINTLLVALVLTSIAIAGMILSKNSMTRLADSNEAIKDRLKIFEIGIDKIMDRPWVGGGVGSDRKLLLPEYRKKGLAVAFEEKYNLHNQFLQTSLELGLLGLAIFIILLFYFIICSQQKWLALQILFVFCMFFLVESVLERQSGVVSFTVWGMILSLKGPPDKVQRND